MPMTEAEFAQRIQQKPMATQEQIEAAMPYDARGRRGVKVGGRLVPLMPTAASQPAVAPGAAAVPVGLPANALPPAVDHTGAQTPVKDQGDRPTCVSFAFLAAMEALVKRGQNGREINLSEQYAHWLFMSSQGKTQCEASPFTVQAAHCLQQAGVCEDVLCPYLSAAQVAAACTAPPSAAAHQQATYGLGSSTPLFNRSLAGKSLGNTDYLESMLADDLDVVVGFEGIFGLTDPLTGALDIFRDGSGNPWPAQAGHAMLAVGYTRDPVNPYFVFKNSWLDSAGDGYMKVSYDYLRQYATCGVIPYQVRTDMPVNGNGGGNGAGGGNGG